MDSEYIAALSVIEQDNVINQSLIVINASITLGKSNKSYICLGNWLEDWFIGVYQKAKVLESIINARNSQYGILDK